MKLTVDQALEKAKEAGQAGNLSNAATIYRTIVQANPSHAEANHNLGVILASENKFDEALPFLKVSVDSSLNVDQFWISYIEVLIKGSRLKEAAEMLKRAEKSGLAKEKLRDLSQAVESTTKGPADDDAKKAHSHYNLGNELQELGRLAEAEESYRNAIVLRPNVAQVHNNLGNTLKAMGRLGEAEESFKKAIELKPDFFIAYNNYGTVLDELDKFAESEASYRKAIALNPTYSEAYSNLGSNLRQLGKLKEAEASYTQAIALNPGFAQAHSNLGAILQELGRLDEAEVSYRKAIELKPDYAEAYSNLGMAIEETGDIDEAVVSYQRMLSLNSEEVTDSERPSVTALCCFGRSGSNFFHSLFDGHPELATLPGPYFKGWFGLDVWKRFAPDYTTSDWRELLVAKVLSEYQPLFDPYCKKNVIGEPHGVNPWLAENLGFMGMGPDGSQALVLDQEAFSQSFLELLKPLSSIGVRECFELIHQAFDISIRGNTGSKGETGGHLFYHIHNPGPYELGHFLKHYPQAKVLYIVRDPIQNLESWIWDKTSENQDEIAGLEERWKNIVGRVANLLVFMQLPFSVDNLTHGVALEDVKRDADQVMPRIAQWMGISDHPELYESSYCGLQYWGPGSSNTGKISGFDTKAIDHEVGRFFGSRDILILETLFWPFSKQFGYTKLDSKAFRRQLKEIRPWLDEPLEFEKKLYEKLSTQNCALEDMPPYIRTHNLLIRYWDLLNQNGTYKNLLRPIAIIK
jgi:tetratricopeptide (TPR) repeat protein